MSTGFAKMYNQNKSLPAAPIRFETAKGVLEKYVLLCAVTVSVCALAVPALDKDIHEYQATVRHEIKLFQVSSKDIWSKLTKLSDDMRSKRQTYSGSGPSQNAGSSPNGGFAGNLAPNGYLGFPQQNFFGTPSQHSNLLRGPVPEQYPGYPLGYVPPLGFQAPIVQGQSQGASYGRAPDNNNNRFNPPPVYTTAGPDYGLYLTVAPQTSYGGGGNSACPPGVPGNAGYPGEDGMPGDPGSSGLQGKDGNQRYETDDAGCQVCPPGPSGDRGLPGVLGIQGARGYRGERGLSGVEGQHGVGRGPPGSTGPPGRDGNPGRYGSRGRNVQGGIGRRGVRGDPGPRGIVGPSGEKGYPSYGNNEGPAGRRGRPGPKGRPSFRGEPGDKGDYGLPGADAAYCSCPGRPGLGPAPQAQYGPQPNQQRPIPQQFLPANPNRNNNPNQAQYFGAQNGNLGQQSNQYRSGSNEQPNPFFGQSQLVFRPPYVEKQK